MKTFVPHSGRIMLTAFWPRDVVAVPNDYQGGKIRVAALEVIDEVDKTFVDEFLAANRTIVQGYTFEPLPAWETADVGDVVRINNNDGYVLFDREVEVIAIDPDEDSDARMKRRDNEGNKAWVDNDDVIEIVSRAGE